MKIVAYERHTGHARAGLLIGEEEILDLSRAFSIYAKSMSQENPEDTEDILLLARGMSASTLEILRGSDTMMAHCFELEKRALKSKYRECLVPLKRVMLREPVPETPLVIQGFLDPTYLGYYSEFLEIPAEQGSPALETNAPPLYQYGAAPLCFGAGERPSILEGEKLIDYTVQLAAYISEPLRDASEDDVEDAIIGYSPVIQFVGRKAEQDTHSDLLSPVRPSNLGMCIGPWLLTKESVESPGNLSFSVQHNGKTEGTGSTETMKHSIIDLARYSSEALTLPTGTLLLSGPLTGAGILFDGTPCNADDVIQVDFATLGCLKTRLPLRFRPRTYGA